MGTPELGIAIAKRTGERRLLTREEYLALDEASDGRWEFFGVKVDPGSGAPDSAELREFGFTSGGPMVIPGDLVEVQPGFFRRIDEEVDAVSELER